MNSHRHFCFIGDFNCRLGSVTRDLCKANRVPLHKLLFLKFVKGCNCVFLMLTKDFFEKPTGKGARTGRSIVDYAISPVHLEERSLLVEAENFETDHRLLKVKWKHSVTVTETPPKPGISLICLPCEHWAEWSWI